MHKSAAALILVLLFLWLVVPSEAEDKPAPLSPSSALGSYSLNADKAGSNPDLMKNPKPRDVPNPSGFSPEVTVGGEIELRYQIRGR